MDGLDQPSTAGAPAALPRVGRTIRHHPHACGVRAATSWGTRGVNMVKMQLQNCSSLI